MHAIKPSFAQSFGRTIAVGITVTALLVSKWCGAKEAIDKANPPQKCSVIYINGDVVITCKRAS